MTFDLSTVNNQLFAKKTTIRPSLGQSLAIGRKEATVIDNSFPCYAEDKEGICDTLVIWFCKSPFGTYLYSHVLDSNVSLEFLSQGGKTPYHDFVEGIFRAIFQAIQVVYFSFTNMSGKLSDSRICNGDIRGHCCYVKSDLEL